MLNPLNFALAVSCPVCGHDAGSPCTDGRKKRGAPHHRRVNRYNASMKLGEFQVEVRHPVSGLDAGATLTCRLDPTDNGRYVTVSEPPLSIPSSSVRVLSFTREYTGAT